MPSTLQYEFLFALLWYSEILTHHFKILWRTIHMLGYRKQVRTKNNRCFEWKPNFQSFRLRGSPYTTTFYNKENFLMVSTNLKQSIRPKNSLKNRSRCIEDVEKPAPLVEYRKAKLIFRIVYVICSLISSRISVS